MYTASEDVWNVIEDAFNLDEGTWLQCLIDDIVNSKVHHSFKHAHDKVVTDPDLTLYQMMEHAAANTVYLRGANGEK